MRAIRLWAAAAAVAAVVAVTPVAGSGQVADAGAAGRLAAAEELLAAANWKDAMLAGMELAMDQQISANPELADTRDVFMQWARDVLSSTAARREFAGVYADTFTEAEMRQIIAFYRTPTGRKLAAQQGSIALRAAALGQRLAQENQADLIARLQNRSR